MSQSNRLWLIGIAMLLWLAFTLITGGQRRTRFDGLKPLPADVPVGLWRLYRQYLDGHLNVPLLEALRGQAQKGLDLNFINIAICLEVASGRYEQALKWRELWTGGKPDETELLVRINEAEALANLGRLEDSLAWIDREGAEALTRAGIAAHRAWCLASLGRPDEGTAVLSKAKPSDLGHDYQSEWYLSAAAIEVAARRWEGAADALGSAERCAKRASTKRNISFGRGRLLAAQGLHLEALPHFEQGASAVYVGQGGDALLAWGDSLRALVRDDDARRAWELCIERDPQAPAAATARTRVESTPRTLSAG